MPVLATLVISSNSTALASETLRSELESEKETLRSALESEQGGSPACRGRSGGWIELIPQTTSRRRRRAAHRAEKDKLQAELRWRIAQVYAVDVTLDPNTAHPNLVLSEDQKTVTYDDRRQDRPENPERFTTYPTALGTNGFTGGRFYWEVEMGDKTNWTVGVCRESVIRTGKVRLTPGNGHWAVWLRDGKYEACTSSPRTPLPVSVRPRRVGIFLDYEEGKVSFYNVTDRSHLFTFTDTFSGTLRPYFYVGYKEEGKNTAPLTICPVPAQAGGNLCP
ncbi:E3 ubiquitin-protein ligase TRIM39-like [Chrysemys picta bellii]|uniref:E3 ubiquitin-protein ligase TRIM39-like n=1 Tax=Chrysemys picta bellii TaxID=8478 RepID=UPI0032B1F851